MRAEVLADHTSQLTGRVFLNQMAGFGQDLESSVRNVPRELATLLNGEPSR